MPRHLKTDKILASIDLETTGTNPVEDRICSMSIVHENTDGARHVWRTLVNPLKKIKKGATAVHGITNEMVNGYPPFSYFAENFKKSIDNCVLVGYGIVSFDLLVLSCEFERCNVSFNMSDYEFVDCQRIFFDREPRTLEAALKKFCEEDLEDAHTCDADAIAALDVLHGQISTYTDLPLDVHELAKSCIPKDAVDPTGKLKIREDGTVYFNFGQYNDEDLLDVALNDPSYLTWIISAAFHPLVKEACQIALEQKGMVNNDVPF